MASAGSPSGANGNIRTTTWIGRHGWPGRREAPEPAPIVHVTDDGPLRRAGVQAVWCRQAHAEHVARAEEAAAKGHDALLALTDDE